MSCGTPPSLSRNIRFPHPSQADNASVAVGISFDVLREDIGEGAVLPELPRSCRARFPIRPNGGDPEATFDKWECYRLELRQRMCQCVPPSCYLVLKSSCRLAMLLALDGTVGRTLPSVWGSAPASKCNHGIEA